MSDDILKTGVEFVKRHKRYPSQLEMVQLGVTRASIREAFGNLGLFHNELADHVGEYICDLTNHDLKTAPKKSTKRFVITTAVTGAELSKPFFNNIKAYCKDNSAELLVMISSSGKPSEIMTVSPLLKDEVFIMEDTELNKNVFLLGLSSNATKVDPVAGLPRIGQRNGTFICASPKQRLKYVATGPNKLPHALMSTGAITKPNYIKSRKFIKQSMYVADSDHEMGAIILELDSNDVFHFRQIQSDKAGNFVDLGMYYSNGKRSFMRPEAFILGDWHSGETSPVAKKAWVDVSKRLKVKRWIIHDGFSGQAINHHEEGRTITLAKKADDGRLHLQTELDGYAQDLVDMTKVVPEVVIVKSNHDEFLERYLEEARYVSDPQNHHLSLRLALVFLEGENPVEHYVHEIAGASRKNIRWLRRDEDYKIAGIQLASHGDKGANGARGSINALENAHGNVIYGHSHTPEIQRGAYCVGTSTHTKPDYGTGPSSWMNTSCLLYANGQRQLINVIDGKWTTLV